MNIKRTIITTIVALALVATVAPATTQAVTIEELMADIARLTAQLQALQGTTGTTTGTVPAACVGVTFNRYLKVGMDGKDVQCMQVLMNTHGFILATTGAGSPGMETTYFGPRTLGAVKAMQVAQGWVPANQVGPKTTALFNSWLAGSGTTNPPPVTPPVGGALSVQTAYNNPASTNVANSSAADFLRFTLTAGSNQVTVNKLYVTRTGLSTNNAVSNIKIIDNATGSYVGSIGSLNANNQALIVFTQGLVIPANTSKEFTVRASAATYASDYFPAGNTVALGINGSDITSTASSVTGSAMGNVMSSVYLTTLGSLTVAQDGTTVDSAPEIGSTGVTLNQFTLAAGSNEDVTISAITMIKAGTIANNNVANFTLYDATKGTTLATVPALNADGRATWGNLNLVIQKGATERFKIKADIIGGNSADTVNADIIDGSDTTLIVAKGNVYGFYITPTNSWGSTGYPGTTAGYGLGRNNQTLQTSALTVAKSTLTPATGNTSAGSDKTLAVFDFTAASEQVKVSSLRLSATLGSMTYDQVTAIKIYDENGTIVAGPQDLLTCVGASATNCPVAQTASYGYITFTDTFIVPTGTHHYTVKAKLASDVGTGDTIKIGVYSASDDITATGMLNNDTISASGSLVYGNTLTVKAASLTITTNNTPASRYVAVGSSDVVFGTFTLSAASSGEDIQVTSVTILDGGSGSNDFYDLSSLAIYTGDNFATKISNTYNPSSAIAYYTFPLTQTITVPAGGYVTIALKGSVKTSAGAYTHIMELQGSSTTGTVAANGASTGTALVDGDTATYSHGGHQTVTISTTGGALTVSKDSTSPIASLIVGNSDVTLAVFQLRASNVEDLSVTEMTLDVTTGGDIASYSFYQGADTTPLRTVTGGTAPKIVLNSGELIIPAGGYKIVTVKARTNSVDGTTVANGDSVTATIQGTNVVKAIGLGSGAEVTTSSVQSAVGSTMKLVRAKPVFTVDSASPSGTGQVGNASQLVAVFDLKNEGEDDITFSTAKSNTLVLNLSRSLASSNGTAGTWYLKDGATTLSSDSVEDSDTEVTFSTWSTTLTVGAGTTKKLYVYGDTSDYTHTTSTTDSLQVYLDVDTAADLSYSVTTDGSASTTIDAANYMATSDIFAGRLSY